MPSPPRTQYPVLSTLLAVVLAVGAVGAVAAQEPPPFGTVYGPINTRDARIRVEVVATGLEVPSSLAFLPDGDALICERPSGRMSLLDLRTGARTPLEGVPPVFGENDAGLHDVILHPNYATNHLIYFSYSEKAATGSGSVTVVDRARLNGTHLENRERLFTAVPPGDTAYHYGGRLVLQNGYLFITVGEREERYRAQDLDSDNGKVLRLFEDGRVPPDNPFVNHPGARSEIWSYGHRNPQGLAVRPETGDLWEDEHGPKGGDEVNLIRPGLDYGWPIVTYGREYSDETIGDGITWKEGMEQPIYFYVPSIAPSDMLFYTGTAFPKWRGNLFIGAMGKRHLNRLVLQGDQVVREERILGGRGWRVRVVKQGPDGFLYLGVDQGMLLRIRPAD